MTAVDFYETIVERSNRKPFRPYIVELIDGSQIEIDRPRALAIRGGVAAGFARGRKIVRLDSYNVKQIYDAPVETSASQEV